MSEERDKSADRGFTVSDKRRFDEEGNVRETPEQGEPRAAAPPAGEPEQQRLPDIDFSTFILSLTTSAMVHLGDAPHPDGTTKRELALAKQVIDILAILKQKTEGNRTDEESRLMDEVLYDLRLRYVAASRRS